ncbi:MAG: bifunctional demethylmenaquinone methyltransferase/2-methoxy-6-polyprenyl-1,4-benzoquinol methylase UbiE [Verrucomicrobia bacterium]|nr:bifunctional demethylmenaquinone methyltransferase/2-methoxy-6-polyprenyl-1,4-benzoquinol methylase UbiE [Verrucomicrobiota bacterium]
MPEAEAVRSMFGGIAKRYDLANHLLSGGMDYWWRKVLVTKVHHTNPSLVVDLATGSGDVAFALKSKLGDSVQVQGLDFCRPMLDEAEKKRLNRSPASDISFAVGDILNLSLSTNTIDAITVAFGIRNLENRARGLQEIHRTLRAGGHLFILEFSQPYAWFRPLYYAYLKYFLPTFAGWITRQPDAYNYLGDSIEAFPTRQQLLDELKAAGFTNLQAYPMTLGIVAIHQGTAT